MERLKGAVLLDNDVELELLVHEGNDELDLPKLKELAALAAKTGSHKCLVFLNTLAAVDKKTWHAAAIGGQLHILQLLAEISPETEPGDAIYRAAGVGHLGCLQFLHGRSPFRDVLTTYICAFGGHRDCLAYLIDSGWPIDASVTQAAAWQGHIDCLRYLRFRGCPWAASTTEMAAAEGQYACLEYAVENGCPMGDAAFSSAIDFAQSRCLESVLLAGHRPGSLLKVPFLCHDSQVPCVELAAQHGVSFHPGQVVLAASLGNLKLVRLLYTPAQGLWHSALDHFNNQHLPPDHTWEEWARDVGGRGWQGDAEQGTVWGGVLHVGPSGEQLQACWGTLRFGSVHGAPMTPRAQALVDERRACAQEVLRCFHAAPRLVAAGRPETSKWDAMSRLPTEVLLIIMELAKVEIVEAFH